MSSSCPRTGIKSGIRSIGLRRYIPVRTITIFTLSGVSIDLTLDHDSLIKEILFHS
jgi:hypothetical protein